jgi:hypothetical protein
MQMGRRSVLAGLLLAVLVVGLSGCGRFTDTIAPGDEVETVALYGTRTISQRFVAHHAGLVEIGVLLQAQPGSGAVTLHLREDAEGTSDMATVTIVPPASEALTYHTFALPVQDDVNGKSFLLLLEAPQATGETAALLPYSTGASGELDLWLDGDLSSGGHLSFQLHYEPVFIVKDLARQASTFGLRSLWLLFLSALFYLLPGGALVVWLLREGDWIERTVVALGMSVAVYALLVYATMTGLRLGRAATYGFLALCAGLIGLRWWLDGRPLPSLRGMWAELKVDPAAAALAFVFALALGVRIFVVRDLVAPMWGDGYHHTMISQLQVDNGGLFDSWEPYAPLTTFTYHFGFHANVALFHWLSGEPVIQSVIWIGQMMNALAVLTLYPMAVKVSGGNRWAGVGAVLVAGLLSPMPMYYVNWSRYTQLAGQVILPVLMWMTWQLVEARRWHWRLVGLATVACVGLGVTHYRVVALYSVFAAVLGFASLVRRWQHRHQPISVVGRLGIVGAATLLILVPWGVALFGARIPRIAQAFVEQSTGTHFVEEYNAIPDAFSMMPLAVSVLSVAGGARLVCLRRIGEVLILVLWMVGLLLLANPALLGLPGAGVVNNFTVFIMLYLPLGLLAGACASAWGDIVRAAPWRQLAMLVLLLSAGWGTWRRVRDLGLEYAMVTRQDVEAMDWIRDHTPPDARFLVNAFAAYGETMFVGADAGWWLPLLAGRANTVPPITYGMEVGPDPYYHQKVNEFYFSLRRVPPSLPEGAQFLRTQGVKYVYIGRGMGQVGNPGQPLLDSQALADSALYKLVYQRDGVSAFVLP